MAGREEAIERDRSTCRGCGRAYTQVHHIKFRSQGGSDEADNLVCLCDRCHQRAHGLIEGQTLSQTMLKAIIQVSGNIDKLYLTHAICLTCNNAYTDALGRNMCKIWEQEVLPINYCERHQRMPGIPGLW